MDRDVTKLLYVSTAKYGGDWHSLMHTHACTELFYVVGGMGQFKVAEKLIPVSPDDLVIVNPNVEHTEVSLNASPLEYIVLGVEGMEFAADENGDRRYSAFNFHSGREDILPYLRGMLREIEQKSAGYEVVCQDLLEVLVVKLMRHTDFSLTVTPAQQSSKECAEARRYIDSNFKKYFSGPAGGADACEQILSCPLLQQRIRRVAHQLSDRTAHRGEPLPAGGHQSLPVPDLPHAGFFLPQLLLPEFP